MRQETRSVIEEVRSWTFSDVPVPDEANSFTATGNELTRRSRSAG